MLYYPPQFFEKAATPRHASLPCQILPMGTLPPYGGIFTLFENCLLFFTKEGFSPL